LPFPSETGAGPGVLVGAAVVALGVGREVVASTATLGLGVVEGEATTTVDVATDSTSFVPGTGMGAFVAAATCAVGPPDVAVGGVPISGVVTAWQALRTSRANRATVAQILLRIMGNSFLLR
jgi:hypothetical protein